MGWDNTNFGMKFGGADDRLGVIRRQVAMTTETACHKNPELAVRATDL